MKLGREIVPGAADVGASGHDGRVTAQVEFTPDRDLYPFASRWFESDVGRVHYVDEGEGTPILFCHGNPTWSFLYRKIVRELRDRFRCVAVDYPGFGLSVRPDAYGYTAAEHARVVGALVDELSLDGFIVMGQDWGGPVGMSVATERAERVRGIVLGNTWFWPVERLATKVFSRVLSSGYMQRRILERNYFVERVMPRAMTHELTPREMDHYRGVQPTSEARRGVAELPRQLLDADDFLAGLWDAVPARLWDKPALLTWGMKDFAFPARSHISRIRLALPHAEVVELPRANHFIQEDAPHDIVRGIALRFG